MPWLRVSDSALSEGSYRPGLAYVRYIGAGLKEIAVARYYFDIHDGAQSVRDDEGSDFDRLDAAVQAAARLAAETGTGRLAKGDTNDVVIGVRDEHNQRICTVKASMEIEWYVSRSQGPILGAHRCRSQHR
jgi:hypothetical protein